MQTILLAGCPHRAHFVNKETIFPTYRDFESPSHLRRLESPCILIDRIEDEERERERDVGRWSNCTDVGIRNPKNPRILNLLQPFLTQCSKLLSGNGLYLRGPTKKRWRKQSGLPRLLRYILQYKTKAEQLLETSYTVVKTVWNWRNGYTVNPGYNDISLCDTSSIMSDILWYQ